MEKEHMQQQHTWFSHVLQDLIRVWLLEPINIYCREILALDNNSGIERGGGG